MRVVDLTLVLVDDTVDLIGQVRLMVPCLRQDHDLRVHVCVATSLIHVLHALTLRGVANDDTARVASISEVHRVLFLIEANDCASTETAIEARLLLKFHLHIQEC